MKKFLNILSKEDLLDHINGQSFETIEIESIKTINSDKLNQKLFNLKEKIHLKLLELKDEKISNTDPIFSDIFYNELKDLAKRDLADLRFWQWLTLEHFQEYAWKRWGKENTSPKKIEKIKILRNIDNKNEDKEETWSPIIIRLLGGTSLKSLTSRQCISRLFWPYKILEDRNLINKCFEKQDIAVAVFERQFGLHPAAAKAFIENISIKYKKLDKKDIQIEAKKLNRYFATINPDYLEQNNIKDLIFESNE